MEHVINFGGMVAKWMMTNPELSCAIMGAFLVWVAVSIVCKFRRIG